MSISSKVRVAFFIFILVALMVIANDILQVIVGDEWLTMLISGNVVHETNSALSEVMNSIN